jgi:predicted Zn-dependent protease with MMP-like domain
MRLIDGEYDKVAVASSNPALLTLAHKVLISQESAEQLVNLFLPGISISYRGYRGGAGSSSGITLPVPDNKWQSQNTVIGKLRAGIVLHEIAHLLQYAKSKYFSHDQEFTQILDRIVASSRPFWMIP